MAIDLNCCVEWDFDVPEKYADDEFVVVGQDPAGECRVLCGVGGSMLLGKQVVARARTMASYNGWVVVYTSNPLWVARQG